MNYMGNCHICGCLIGTAREPVCECNMEMDALRSRLAAMTSDCDHFRHAYKTGVEVARQLKDERDQARAQLAQKETELAAVRGELAETNEYRDRYATLSEDFRQVLRDIGKAVGCLTSSFPDGNAHVVAKCSALVAERDAALAKLGEAEKRAERFAEALRLIARRVGGAVGPECTDDFHCYVADEVGLVVEKLKMERNGEHVKTNQALAQRDEATGLLRECGPTLLRLLNNADSECSICGGDATPDTSGHHKACTVRRLFAFLSRAGKGVGDG